MKPSELFPIGTRVTHFDGGPGTHGTGTIVGYNTREYNGLLASLPKPLAVLIVKWFNPPFRPYIVNWDASKRYPNGYKHVYGKHCVWPVVKSRHHRRYDDDIKNPSQRSIK